MFITQLETSLYNVFTQGCIYFQKLHIIIIYNVKGVSLFLSCKQDPHSGANYERMVLYV